MLEAPIVEIFSSIQGEGLLVGRRQIFVRFAGCNLNCSYCDTEASKSSKNGTIKNVDYVVDCINKLKTPDLHSVSFTGGEPSLYADFIKEVIDKIDFPGFLETNGTLTKEINKIDNLDYASLDIKVPENLDDAFNSKIISSEINSINLLIEKGIIVYCKIVVLPSLDLKLFENLISNISEAINEKNKVSVIIQPVSPIELWKNNKNKLFKFSEIVGKYMDVLVIPQLHKFMDIE
ncbi:radical SAM protein [Methanobrevibacter sp. 87.7]|uniref:7-carboxy-7-deazaguanine synthase QueE n=1 Tax=Methanobrevibacter sp. 87.7 TaxID=387957 RepID=UPI000B626DE5|nr:7-carboxy-7-deazaguanine synthase QueE [Methanobrevibacter sp. 87.7]OWT32679.1 radical SAM protein [Methanobrevibacter sp. 87.7]